MKTETEHLNIDVIFEVGTLTGELVVLGFFICLFKDSQFTLTIELLFRCSFFSELEMFLISASMPSTLRRILLLF